MSAKAVLGLLLLGNVPLYVILGRAFFHNWRGFREALRLCFRHELHTALRGEAVDAIWAALKVSVFVGLCGCAVYGEYTIIVQRLLT